MINLLLSIERQDSNDLSFSPVIVPHIIEIDKVGNPFIVDLIINNELIPVMAFIDFVDSNISDVVNRDRYMYPGKAIYYEIKARLSREYIEDTIKEADIPVKFLMAEFDNNNDEILSFKNLKSGKEFIIYSNDFCEGFLIEMYEDSLNYDSDNSFEIE